MKIDVYDPRLEQVRAQGQAIYETHVLRATGKKAFRDFRTGRRADRSLSRSDARKMIRRYLFQMGTGVAQKHGRLIGHTRRHTGKSARESEARYGDGWADALLRNRQDYEESLGIARKSGFYRVVAEPTRAGVRFFVWPLPPGARIPGPASVDPGSAKVIAKHLNATADPFVTGRWWTPPKRAYTASQLKHWMAFPSKKQKRRSRRRRSA